MFLIKRTPYQPRKPKSPTFQKSAAGPNSVSFDPGRVVGIAHVGVGVLGLLGGLAAIGFWTFPGGPSVTILICAAIILAAIMQVVAGLWISDGKRRGAYVSVAINSFVVLFWFLGMREVNFSAVIALALLGAVAWLLPTMEH